MKEGQAIAFLDGELVAVDDSVSAVAKGVLGEMDLGQAEVVTLYYGADATSAEAEEIALALRQRHPELDVEVIYGGQPHYHYFISVE